MGTAAENTRNEIARHGPILFSRFQELALYGPSGFYEHGGAGRHRDFLTSPEVGPLFGAVIARWLDRLWDDLGQPDPFVVIEPGAGPGRLAAAVLRAEPRCSPALRYVLVDRSQLQREQQAKAVTLSPALEALAAPMIDQDGGPVDTGVVGPVVISAEHLPHRIPAGALVANELFDNLPTEVLERTASGWSVLRVGAEESGFVEVLTPANETLSAVASRFAPDCVSGQRIPIQLAASAELKSMLGCLGRGKVLAFDYARTTPQLGSLPQTDWLRTYAAHAQGPSPLERPGTADITCDVALDQLTETAAPSLLDSQAAWLANNGIDDLVEEGKALWAKHAAEGGIAAIEGRSRIREAEALTEPEGLGGFSVFEWDLTAQK